MSFSMSYGPREGGRGKRIWIDDQQHDTIVEALKNDPNTARVTAHVSACTGSQNRCCRVRVKNLYAVDDKHPNRLIDIKTNLPVVPIGERGDAELQQELEHIIVTNSLTGLEQPAVHDIVIPMMKCKYYFFDDEERIKRLVECAMEQARARSTALQSGMVTEATHQQFVQSVENGFLQTIQCINKTNETVQGLTNIVKMNSGKIAQYGTRLDEHGTRLDEHDTRSDEQDTRLDGHDSRLDEHEARMDAQNSSIFDVTRRLTLVEEQLTPYKRSRETVAVTPSIAKQLEKTKMLVTPSIAMPASAKQLKKTGKYALSSDERKAIKKYSSDSEIINKALRRGFIDQETLEWAELLKSALSKLPRFEGTVYRGATFDEEQISFLQKSKVFVDSAFLSTSEKPFKETRMNAFDGKNCQFKIQSKTGRAIQKFVRPQYKHELEVLFAPSTKFEVISMKNEGSKHYFELKEADP